MKPIETAYKGYRFRSRLEARWAVFFDSLGIEYEYEKEGFDLGKAGRYLPDFYLPQIEAWFEVKAKPPLEEEINKAESLRDHSDRPVIISTGSFDGVHTPLCEIYCGDLADSSGGSYSGTGYLEIKNNKPVFIIQNDTQFHRGDRTMYSSGSFEKVLDWIYPKGLLDTIDMYETTDPSNQNNKDISKLRYAVIEARSARFEFKK